MTPTEAREVIYQRLKQIGDPKRFRIRPYKWNGTHIFAVEFRDHGFWHHIRDCKSEEQAKLEIQRRS